MKKRLTALLLVLSLVLSLGATVAFATGTDAMTVTIADESGAAVSAVELPTGGSKVNLTALADRAEGYQWQLQVSEDLWVDISGETAQTCGLTYAMVASLLDSDWTAHVRCAVTVSGEEFVSGPVEISVYDDSAVAPVSAFAFSRPLTTNGTTFNLEPSSDVEPLDASTDDNGTTPVTYNVVINYVFENNEIVADPYTANLAAGSNFSATVSFPTVQGYLPYVGEATESTTSMDLNITNIQEDVTYTVVYKPTNVDYTVIHYQQNVDNDQYTVIESEPKQGLTNSEVPEVAKTYEGFYSLLYEKPAIAADGSTVVEVYYDRYYYLMNFDLDGGYGVEPIYARYGAPIGDVGTPTKAGFTFSGWSLDGTNTVDLPSTMPAENRTYKAVWEADATAKVTVVFWGENADDEEYSYIKSAQVNVKPGTEFTYSEDGSLICALEEHTHSIENCYSLTCTQEVHTHSESCYTCGQTEHTTHTTACYAGVGNKQAVYTDVPNNPVNGQVVNHWYYRKLIYINGSWYRYSGSTADGSIAPMTCGGIHTHTDACLGCGKTEHTHSIDNGCYTLTCTKTEHSHTSDCYMAGAGLDSNLWTFVKSDTVTVAADGSSVVNVYYDRTEFTLTFKDGRDTVYTLKEKWGADISEHWPIKGTNGTTYNSGERWRPSGSNTYTKVLVYLAIMPAESFTLTVNSANYDTYIMHYMVETLPGESGTSYNGKTFKESFLVTAKYNFVTEAEDFFDLDGFTQWASNPSFRNGEIDIDGGGYVYFYYTRNSYTLTFNDGYNDVKSESVQYEAPLSTYSSYVPETPSAYAAGSVTFGGWYLNPECTGEEYKLDEHTMPADNVLLYAKWAPVSHTVEFYLDQAALKAGTKLSTHSDITVPHGSKADPTPANPTNGSYTFIGWFYMENGVEKAFDFANMPVTKDMKVYGKWSSNVLKQYFVYYKIQGTDTEIAAPTTGSGLAGTTKTFEAKGGTELYADYQEGYFPIAKSHSLTLDINATAENNTNAYTFWYVQKEAVPYTVKYLNKETGEPVATEKTVSDNRKAVVTETFVPVSGMLPDAYQKRLVVSAEEGAVNEIIFYYTEDTTHAYYKITHYTENLATDAYGNPTWTEYASSQAVGDIGTTYPAEPLTNVYGFTYDSNVPGTVASGELTADGLELKLYYTRNSYDYEVRYLEQGTGKELREPTLGNGKFGQVVSESAIEIKNYEAVAPTSQTLTIRIQDSEHPINIITFYYKEKEVTINYQVVGAVGSGTVTPTSETLKVMSGTAKGSTAAASENYDFKGWYSDAACTKLVGNDPQYVPGKNAENVYEAATYYAKFEEKKITITYEAVGPDGVESGFGSVDPVSEEVPVVNGPALGSTPTAEANFRFVGWYKDAACTTPVSTSDGTVDGDNKFTPAKPGDVWTARTFYAKFEYDLADLTITKTGAQTIDENQTFIFRIVGASDNDRTRDINMRVVIQGNGQVTVKDLPIGTYTVTEETTWSWRYQPKSSDQSITLSPTEPNTVQFVNNREKIYWLDGSAYSENAFGPATTAKNFLEKLFGE